MNIYVEMRFRGSAEWVRIGKAFKYEASADKNAAAIRAAGFAARTTVVRLGRPTKAN